MQIDLEAVPLLVTATLNAAIGVYVYLRKPTAHLNRAFGFMAIATVLWTIGIVLSHYSDAPNTFVSRFAFASASLIPIGTVAVAQSFSTSRGHVERFALWVVAPIALAWCVISFSPLIVVSTLKGASGDRKSVV